jgi:formylglycine-generating enzyme required for sulfatase activity
MGVPGTCLDVSECIDTRQPTAGLCPGAANIQCCTPRYAVACDPNARPRPNENLVDAPGTGGCPAGMARVSTFCIDQYEAFLEEVDGGTWCPFVNPGSRRMRARSAAGAVPQGFINQTQAAAACAESGKRLCTDTEWLRACRGPTSTTYPYGNARLTGVCNDRRSVHPAIELYGTSAGWIFSHIDSPCLNQLDGGLARSGAFTGCSSAENVFDLMGNLHEWTADPAGTFRGGFYVDTVINGNGCLYVTTAHAVSHWDYSTGFRCCQ